MWEVEGAGNQWGASGDSPDSWMVEARDMEEDAWSGAGKADGVGT